MRDWEKKRELLLTSFRITFFCMHNEIDVSFLYHTFMVLQLLAALFDQNDTNENINLVKSLLNHTSASNRSKVVVCRDGVSL
jgi:hypothetical protein